MSYANEHAEKLNDSQFFNKFLIFCIGLNALEITRDLFSQVKRDYSSADVD